MGLLVFFHPKNVVLLWFSLVASKSVLAFAFAVDIVVIRVLVTMEGWLLPFEGNDNGVDSYAIDKVVQLKSVFELIYASSE